MIPGRMERTLAEGRWGYGFKAALRESDGFLPRERVCRGSATLGRGLPPPADHSDSPELGWNSRCVRYEVTD
jgi:hypothetical protein